jgi:hypothetical protein
LFRNRKVDTNILYLLIGITLTFVSLTAPLQLSGNFITLFWASECVLLYWLFQKSKLAIIKISSVVVWLCMIVSLVMDWINIYGLSNFPLNIVFNKGFVTSCYTAAASYALFLLRQKHFNTGSTNVVFLTPSRNILGAVAIVLLFIGGLLEVNYQFNFYYPTSNLNLLYLELYVFVFVLLLKLISQAKPSLRLSFELQMLVLSVCILMYLSLIGVNFDLQRIALTRHLHQNLFAFAHWMVMLLAAIGIYRLIYLFRSLNVTSDFLTTIFSWIICTIILLFVSVELNLLVRTIFYSPANPIEGLQTVYIKTVLPILWGVCSFAFMWLGMKYKFRSLRIISLTLFSITLIKLFVSDIRNIPVAGKIAAFFCLGVLLLVVSFMYQRLKKILVEDGNKTSL